MRKTKIVATLGPTSSTEQVLSRLIRAGMDVARLNFSHGKPEEHRRLIHLIRRVSKKEGRPISILVDLQGPKIRIGNLKNGGPAQLIRGKTVRFTTKPILGDAQLLSTTYPYLHRDVKKGDPILLDDGRICLEVTGKRRGFVECRIIQGGWLKEKKGMNLPKTDLSQRALTPKDLKDVVLAVKEKVDYLALSFVRTANDVERLRTVLKKRRSSIPIIAKIERAESLQNLDEILKASDGVMVARGDLGVEVSFEKVPLLQKEIIRKSNHYGVPVITATQMLESMIQNAQPTRAEVTDVANAIFDGTDALMLSGETASGLYPVESIKVMDRIAREAEKGLRHDIDQGWDLEQNSIPHAIVHAACHAAEDVGAKAILVFTMTGKTAVMLSKRKPNHPIYCFAENQEVYQRLPLLWGTIPLRVTTAHSTDEMVRLGEKKIHAAGFLKKGDRVVIVAGTTHLRGATDMLKVHTVS